MYSPLEQFELVSQFMLIFKSGVEFRLYLILSNLDFTYIISCFELLFFNGIVSETLVIFYNYFVFFFELFYLVSLSMVRSTVGTMRKINNLVGLIVVLFFFILILNLIGLIPFGFCLTSQFVITQFLGFFAIGGLTLKGFQNLSFKFLFVFVPRNVPIFMLPFLMLIELVSFLSRMLSLSIRLFANMVAGHALLHILMGALLLVFSMNSFSIVLLICFFVPSILIFFIMLLEIGIAFLQAYVFVVLFLIYLTDCYKVH